MNAICAQNFGQKTFISYPILFCLSLSHLILFCLTLSYPILSCLTISYFILSCLTLSYLVISCLTLSYPILSYPILPFVILSFLTTSNLILFCLTYLMLSYNYAEVWTVMVIKQYGQHCLVTVIQHYSSCSSLLYMCNCIMMTYAGYVCYKSYQRLLDMDLLSLCG